jgi:hypothetical protein
MADTPRDNPTRPAPDQGGLPSRDRQGVTDVPGNAQRPTPEVRSPDGHEGATEDKVSDRTGPGVGYDQEPEPETGEAGVS